MTTFSPYAQGMMMSCRAVWGAEAPLFAVGTSIGANVLVKYLGEDGVNIPLVGAAAICSPWDLLICDRFVNRKLVQKLHDKALAIDLQDISLLSGTTYSIMYFRLR